MKVAVIGAGSTLIDGIHAPLADVSPGVDLRVSDVPPVVGAVLPAFDLLDTPVPDLQTLGGAVRAAL